MAKIQFAVRMSGFICVALFTLGVTSASHAAPSATDADVALQRKQIGLANPFTDDSTDDESSDAQSSDTQSGDAQSGDEQEMEERPSAVDSLENVRQAVIQIEALSDLTLDTDAELFASTIIGQGSGFIVDPSGLAVTSSQLLDGARFLKVKVAGESLPRKARVVGHSECQDIALLDIQGDDFAYLDWYKGPIRFGLDIYAAGYVTEESARPLYSLLEGVVLNERTTAANNQGAVTSVLQHSSPLTVGKAGGPLIERTGRTVGLNLPSPDGRSFALPRDQLEDAVAELRSDDHLNGIGITSEPADIENGMAQGLRVLSVVPGRPADKLGINPGDVLLSISGNSLISTNPKGVYCAALSILNPDNIIPIEVERPGTKGTLSGQINGQSLDSYFSFTRAIIEEYPELEDEIEPVLTRRPGLVTDEITANSSFVPISEQTNLLTLQIPASWDQIDAGEWQLEGQGVGVQITASPDIDTYYNDQRAPGVFAATSLGLLNLMSREDLLDQVSYRTQCEYKGRFSLPQAYLNGEYDVWEECGESSHIAIVLAASPITRDYVLLMQTYIESEADLRSFDRIWSTFKVNVPSSNRAVIEFDPNEVGEDIDKLVDTDGLIYEYELIENETISALLPSDWTETESDAWIVDDEEVGSILYISPDMDDYQNTWTTPGVLIRSSSTLGEKLDPDEMLDEIDYEQYCEAGRRLEHKHSIYGIRYSGEYDMWFNCGGEQNWLAVLAVENDQTDQLITLEFRNVDLADTEAFRVLIDSMYLYTDELVQSYLAEPNRRDSIPEVAVNFVEVVDDTGLIAISVPEKWVEAKTAEWNVDVLSGMALNVSADLAEYSRSWAEPGLFIAVSSASSDLSPESLLELFDFSEDCELTNRTVYDDTLFEGLYNAWTNCGTENSDFLVVAATSKADPETLILLNVSASSLSDDAEIITRILQSFTIIDQEPSVEREILADEAAAEENERIALAASATDVPEPTATPSPLPTNTPTEVPTEEPTNTPTEVPTEVPTEEPTNTPTEVPTDTPTLRPTLTRRATNTPTDIPATSTPRPTATNRPTNTPTDIPPTSTPRPTRVPTRAATEIPPTIAPPTAPVVTVPQPGNNPIVLPPPPALANIAGSLPPPLAVVTVPRLNIRSGPGLEFPPVSVALEGQQLQVVGESAGCRWLQIIRENGTLAWVSGIDTYVRFATPCGVVQNFQFRQPNTEAPSNTASVPNIESDEPADETVSEEVAIVAPDPAADRALLGCFVFQNPLSVVVTITLTNSDTNAGSTFEVLGRANYEQCFSPGDYTYTLDAPPPWESTNGEISVNAGEQLIFQIRPEEL